MNKYERIVSSLNSDSIIVDDKADLSPELKGYYTEEYGPKVILLNQHITSAAEKACILAEELGHYHTTVGDITDQSKTENRKQELRARRWAVKKLIRVEDFIRAYKAGVRNRLELAEYLEVTEGFIDTSIEHYKGIYGFSHTIGEYTICFSPLWVYKQFE